MVPSPNRSPHSICTEPDVSDLSRELMAIVEAAAILLALLDNAIWQYVLTTGTRGEVDARRAVNSQN